MKWNTLSILFTVILMSCGSGSGKKNQDNTTQVRRGETINSVDPQYFDGHPAISADASRLAFISGRDEGGDLKAYQYTIADATLTRLTDDDTLGSENRVSLSHDGQWAAISVVKSGSSSIYVQSTSDITKRAQIAISGDVVAIPFSGSFSSGSTPFLAFTVQTFVSNRIRSRVFAVTVNADGSVSDAVQVTPDASDESHPQFKGTTLYLLRNGNNGKQTVVSHSVADLTGITQAEGTSVATDLSFDDGIYTLTDKVMFAAQVFDRTEIVPFTDKAASTLTIYSQSRLTETASSTANADGKAYEVIGLRSHDDGTIFQIGRELLDCISGEIFGSTISLVQFSDAYTEVFRGVPLTTADAGFEWNPNPCTTQRTAHESLEEVEKNGVNDFKITDIDVANSTTAGSYSMVYASWLNGDHEIKLVQFGVANNAATNVTFTSIGSNAP